MINYILRTLVEEIAFECEEGCKVVELWDLLQNRLNIQEHVLPHCEGLVPKTDQLDEHTKAYCWLYVKKCSKVILFRKLKPGGTPQQVFETSVVDIDLEPEVLERLKIEGYEFLDGDSYCSTTWEQACQQDVILLADRKTRNSLVCNSSSRVWKVCPPSKDIAWLIIKEIVKSREKGLSQMDLANRFSIDSRVLYHYKKIFNVNGITLCIPKVSNLQHTVQWLHHKYAVFNKDYIKLAKVYFWLNSGVDDLVLRPYFNECQNVLISDDQYLLPIKNTILRILELSTNKAMPKVDIHNTMKYAYKSTSLTLSNLNRVIHIMKKEGLVKVISLRETSTPTMGLASSNQFIVQLNDKFREVGTSHKCYIPNQPCGVLCDQLLPIQILNLILQSKENGISAVSISAHLNGVRTRTVDRFLFMLTGYSKLPNFPYEVYRSSVHIGKERMYLYYAKRKNSPPNAETSSPSIDEEFRLTKKLKTGHSSKVTLTTLNRRKIFLKLVTKRRFIDGFELHSILQQKMNTENNIEFTIDRKTIHRDAKFLCDNNLINKYVTAIPSTTGVPNIKFIYMLPEVSTDSDEFVSFINTLKFKTPTHSKNKQHPKTTAPKDLNFDRFFNWINTKGLIESKSSSMLINNSNVPPVAFSESDSSKSATKEIYTYIIGKMLRVRYLHMLVLRLYCFCNNRSKEKIVFNIANVMKLMNAKDLIGLIQCRNPQSLRYLVSKLLDKEGNFCLGQSKSPLIADIMQLVDPKIRPAMHKLILILESLQLIQSIDSNDADILTRNYELFTEIPFINLMSAKRVTIETVKLNSIDDAEYYWHKLQLSCMYGRDLIKDGMPLTRDMVLQLSSNIREHSGSEWPHFPGYLFTSSGCIACAIWRKSLWTSKKFNEKNKDPGVFMRDHSTAENPHIDSNLEKPQPESSVECSVGIDDTNSVHRVYSGIWKTKLLSCRIPRKAFFFNKNGATSNTSQQWSRRSNEDMIYAVAVLNSIPDHLEINQKAALLAEIFAYMFDSLSSGLSQIEKRLVNLTLPGSPSLKYISQLTSLYVDVRSNYVDDEDTRLESFRNIMDPSALSAEISFLRNAHVEFIHSTKQAMPSNDLESIRSTYSYSNNDSVITALNISTVRKSYQNVCEDACIPRTISTVVIPMLFSKTFSINLENSDLYDDFETEEIVEEDYQEYKKTNFHEEAYFCLQNIIKIITLAPQECYDPLEAFILLSVYPKQLVVKTLDYLWKKKTVVRLRKGDIREHVPMKGVILSDQFVVGLSGISEKSMFGQARELYKKQVQTWTNMKEGRSALKPIYTSVGGLTLLLSELANFQVKLDTSFPDYILDKIKKDTSDSLDYAGVGLYENLQDEFGTCLKKYNIDISYRPSNQDILKINRSEYLSCIPENADNISKDLASNTDDNSRTTNSNVYVACNLEDASPHKMNSRERASLELKKLYFEDYNGQYLHRDQINNTLYLSEDDAINAIVSQEGQRKLLKAIMEVLDSAGRVGLTATDLYFSMIERGFSSDACKEIYILLKLSRRVLMGDLMQPLVSLTGLSRVYYVSHKHSLKNNLRIPSKELWVDILKCVDNSNVTIDSNSPYSRLLNPNIDIDFRGMSIIPVPSRVWYDLRGNIVQSIWISSCKAVACNIAKYSGITEIKLYKMMSYMLTRVELREILNFFIDAKICKVRCFTKNPEPASITDALNLHPGASLFTECKFDETIPKKITYIWLESTWLLLFSAY